MRGRKKEKRREKKRERKESFDCKWRKIMNGWHKKRRKKKNKD